MTPEKTPLEMMEDFNPWDSGDGKTNSLSDFPIQVQEDVNGLMFLGHFEERYEFCGHTFVLRTIKGGEELKASLICKEFNETLGQARAWTWAILSQCLTTIDGAEDWCPDQSTNELLNARARFSYLSNGWYWPTAAFLFARYNELLERQSIAIQAMEDLSYRNQPMSMPSAGSSKPQGNSEPDPPQEDIRDFLEDEGDTTPSN
jgi:hypothetical protein